MTTDIAGLPSDPASDQTMWRLDGTMMQVIRN